MAVVLVIVGLLGALLWQMLPRLQSASSPEPGAVVQLRVASDALVGFALAHSRLPCPDVDGDGLEDCAATAEVGRLPQRTLGQMFPRPLRYGVSRSATSDLTVLSNRFVPNIPGIVPAPQLNGLDLCIGLRTAQSSLVAGVVVGPRAVRSAFALADSGAADASGDGDLFDGLDSGTSFAAPGTPLTASFDDYTAAVGFGELAQRLNCLGRLAAVNGAARAAVAARDLYDLAAFYKDFRHFANTGTRVVDITEAELAVGLAGADVALAAAQLALQVAGLAEAIGSGNAPGAAVLAAIGTGSAAVGVADAAVNLAFAIDDRDAAYEAKDLAQQQDDAASVTKANYQLWANNARDRARAEDALGLIE
ncbi:MAG TPA: hypothetical protein VFG73_11030 [Rhodanobacteraceae bacterium]|nr:hypothetical protein [Rhodanobacteraceae bacterium]